MLATASQAAGATRRKELGAFYTPPEMARKLVRWALRSPGDRVLDPSFGGLVFLAAAHERLCALGASPRQARDLLAGAELDDAAHAAALRDKQLGGGAHRLRHGDFLTFEPERELPLVDAVVGNPPYVRYQGFNGRGGRGHTAAARAGVRLTRLASSWAPFVVHATAFVRDGGRTAQVLPAEILHAQYARAVTAHLRESYAHVAIVVFEQRVFPGALEEVVLLFADGRGRGPAARVELVSCADLGDFDPDRLPSASGPGRAAPADSGESLLLQLVDRTTRKLYRELAASPAIRRLGRLASVDIGAVTGANDFFVVRADRARIPARFLRPTVSKAMHVRGARLTAEDLARLAADGKPTHLLVIDPEQPMSDLAELVDYLEHGRQREVHLRYKCRVREPWWSVPIPKHGVPDAFLTYCSSEHPRLVTNDAGALNTNTVHGVRMLNGIGAEALAAGFVNSLSLLSAELVGRSYGGGVLKLEPSEAEAVLVPTLSDRLAERLPELDRLMRERSLPQALELIDPLVLGSDGLGLSPREIVRLRKAAEQLRARRRARGRGPQPAVTQSGASGGSLASQRNLSTQMRHFFSEIREQPPRSWAC
jgi:adenine-specific DNA-methyltransferase